MGYIILGILGLGSALLFYSACVVGKKSDEGMEMFAEEKKKNIKDEK